MMPHTNNLNPNTVIIGRGKGPKQNEGNQRLRIIVSNLIPQYSSAADKRTKTRIVDCVIEKVRSNGGTFVKFVKKPGYWQQVNDTVIREKVGYVFRDLLGDRYHSSSLSKGKVRRQEQAQQGQTQSQKRVQSKQPLHLLLSPTVCYSREEMFSQVPSNIDTESSCTADLRMTREATSACFSLEPLRIFQNRIEMNSNNECMAMSSEVLRNTLTDDIEEDTNWENTMFEPLELDSTHGNILGSNTMNETKDATPVGVEDEFDDLLGSFYLRRLVNSLEDFDVDTML